MAENGITIEASSLDDFLSVIYEKAAEQAGTETDAVKDAVKTMVEEAETSIKEVSQDDLNSLKIAAISLLDTESLWKEMLDSFSNTTKMENKFIKSGASVLDTFKLIKTQIIAFQEALDNIQNKITFLLYVTKDGDLLLGDELAILKEASKWKKVGGKSSVVDKSMAKIAQLSQSRLGDWINLKTVRKYFLQDPKEARISLSESFVGMGKEAYKKSLFYNNKRFWTSFWNEKKAKNSQKWLIGSSLFPVCSYYNEEKLGDTVIAFWIKKAQNGAVDEAYSQILLNAAFGIGSVSDSIFDQTNEGQIKFYEYMKNADNKPGVTSADLMYNLNNIEQELKDFQINFSVKGGSSASSQSWGFYYTIAQAIRDSGDVLTINEVEKIFKKKNAEYQTKLVSEVDKKIIKELKKAAKKAGQI